jgi:hypothetical protein
VLRDPQTVGRRAARASSAYLTDTGNQNPAATYFGGVTAQRPFAMHRL